jgi:glycosyltransferase involved in cell wall biosynthesis
MSYAEGFGLSTLESMMTGTPIIAAKTGGLTKQVWNSKTKKANGVALDIDVKSLVGSQTVPYIYEDYVSNQNVSKAIFKLYKMSPKEKLRLSKQVLRYAKETFGHQKTVDLWHDTMIDTLNKFKNNNKKWNLIEV